MGFLNPNLASMIPLNLLLLLTALIATSTGNEENGLDPSPPSPLILSLLEGEQTSLSCPINMTSMKPVSVVWFRVADVKFNLSSYLPQSSDDHVVPKKVYALVAPEPPSVTVLGSSVGLVDGAHWKQPPWKGRAFFSLLSDPPALLLNRLNQTDTGRYVCNVSYRGDNATDAGVTVTETDVELFVAAPQQPPVITDSQGYLLPATAGPYAEGDTVRLNCAVPAGVNPKFSRFAYLLINNIVLFSFFFL
ncbi:uncharacterized protein LOC125760227 [Rhipicephalus sanguineus]|uniref:uncharacterized protein LOC125760227 n=1 Tax=Rhipicephalus sanguineus TaxID=34632 RepID=UPI0020C562FA|nr:uncharacterized protein LOC125760227 [Rhipicephalus sanguineus]